MCCVYRDICLPEALICRMAVALWMVLGSERRLLPLTSRLVRAFRRDMDAGSAPRLLFFTSICCSSVKSDTCTHK